MPRRKISIEEAFAVIQQAGIQVQPVPKPVEEPVVRKGQIFPPQRESKGPPKTTKVTLFAKHSIGCGGITVNGVDGKTIEHVGVESYGPGVCYVPTQHVGYLVSQDRIAREADERMLDKVQRSFLVVRKVNADGHTSDVGMQVDNSLFDDIGNIPNNLMYRV